MHYLRILLLLLFPNLVSAQNDYAIARTFTTTDGLPSNNVYRCVEDNKGFLWVATDAGIARFDGKNFQVFTTKDGLPDNEVLYVYKENNGTIWAICFKQNPAYFDEVKNRFVNSNEDKQLAKINGVNLIMGFPLDSNGIMFWNEKGSYIVKNKSVVEYPSTYNPYFLVKVFNDGSLLKWGWSYVDSINKIVNSSLVLIEKNRIIDSSLIETKRIGTYINLAVNGGNFYIFDLFNKTIQVFSNIKPNPLSATKSIVNLPESFIEYAFTDSYICVSSNSGKIYLYDKNSLKLQFILKGNYAPNTLQEDSKGNLWVCSLDKGLILYKKNSIGKIELPQNYVNANFLSIAQKPNGNILAGNYYGEIVETSSNKFLIHLSTQNQQKILRERKIIVSQNKIFSFTEQGVFINYTYKITSTKGRFVNAKTAMAINDSIIIIGTSSVLYKLNTITNEVTHLFRTDKRVNALVKDNKGIIYYGSLDGLSKYDFLNNTTLPINKTNPLLQERVMGLTVSNDNLVWVATSSNGIFALRNDSVILHLTQKQGLINNSTRCIIHSKNGEIWVGTFGGLSKINYQLNNYKINYAIENLTINDGLTSNIFNELLYYKDTIYAATANGISLIPCSIKAPKYNIPVHLINVKVNQRDTIIALKYNLHYDQQNIELQFAGIELEGHFKNVQYKLNNENWVSLSSNTLTLQLNSGIHVIQLNAIDVNGYHSNKILSLQINIETPFWKAIWFWILCGFVFFGTIFYFLQKRNKQIQGQKLLDVENKQRLAQIEMQAIKAQINPHFIFNCLNSIKSLNYQGKYSEADLYTDKFSQLLRNVLDYSSEQTISLEQEINYITNYISLEQLRVGKKLQFQLTIAENINTKTIQIPALLLQPYVENAIRHGIGNLVSENGLLLVNIEQQNEYLIIKIEDNGVGRDKAFAINASRLNYHQSKGMELNKRRVELFNINCSIIDKKNEDETAAGTMVELRILIKE